MHYPAPDWVRGDSGIDVTFTVPQFALLLSFFNSFVSLLLLSKASSWVIAKMLDIPSQPLRTSLHSCLLCFSSGLSSVRCTLCFLFPNESQPIGGADRDQTSKVSICSSIIFTGRRPKLPSKHLQLCRVACEFP